MMTLADLFSFAGRIGRLRFALGVWGVGVVFAAAIKGSLAALPWLAEVLAPRGINAGFALNLIWSALGLLLVWSLSSLTAKRLRDRGRWPWWGVVSVVPLAALALANDAIFLVSRVLTVPRPLELAVLLSAGGIGAWVLAEGLLLGPARD